ncbi:MAG: hypothetical protein KBA75_10015 [Alphaproteobacteria bacterium]|nr:hypothetical protein [Alphaproteobacteria bacterium]
MPTLWLRFTEDSTLPPVLDTQAQQQLAAIFNNANPQSLWRRALQMLKLQPDPNEPMLNWFKDAPYVNWSALTRLVSGDTLRPVAEGDKFTYRENYRLGALWRMTKAQWNISRYVQAQCDPDLPLPDDNAEKLCESLALGCCVLALTMRIPSKKAELLHEGMADASKIPAAFQHVFTHIKAVQQRRNLLSPAWAVLFQHNTLRQQPTNLPAFFWDNPPADDAVSVAPPAAEVRTQTSWRGIPVAGSAVTGRALLVENEADIVTARASTERLVLIFPLARPETVELFPYAAAVLYGDGGALCHACSIAREQNLTCITGLGQGFIRALQGMVSQGQAVVLKVDPATRAVALVP